MIFHNVEKRRKKEKLHSCILLLFLFVVKHLWVRLQCFKLTGLLFAPKINIKTYLLLFCAHSIIDYHPQTNIKQNWEHY